MAKNKENIFEMRKILKASQEIINAASKLVDNFEADTDKTNNRKAKHDEKKRQELKKT